MLYEAERHEELTTSAWDEQVARACIDDIVGDAIDRFSARDLWLPHPLDSFSPEACWNLYIGAAGTIKSTGPTKRISVSAWARRVTSSAAAS